MNTVIKFNTIKWASTINGKPADTSKLPKSTKIKIETHTSNKKRIIDQAINELSDKYGACINSCYAEII